MLSHTGRRSIRLLAMVPVLFLSACFPTATNPLSDPAKAKADEQLAGVWRCEQGDEVIFWFISKPSPLDTPPGVIEVLVVRLGRDGRAARREDRLTLFASRIGEHHYLNMTLPRSHETDGGYLFFRYVVQGDRLTLGTMANDPVRKAIREKTLKGEMRGSLVSISDTTDNLNRFVKKANQDELFPDAGKLVFKRMK